MKQNVHPAVFIGMIVVVAAIAAYFGIRALSPERSPYKMTQQQYEQQMKARMGDRTGGSQGYPGRTQSYPPGYPGSGR